VRHDMRTVDMYVHMRAPNHSRTEESSVLKARSTDALSQSCSGNSVRVPCYDRVQQQAFAWPTPMGGSFVVKAVAAAEYHSQAKANLPLSSRPASSPWPTHSPASDEPSVAIASAVIPVSESFPT
jgi:hypothetical protein